MPKVKLTASTALCLKRHWFETSTVNLNFMPVSLSRMRTGKARPWVCVGGDHAPAVHQVCGQGREVRVGCRRSGGCEVRLQPVEGVTFFLYKITHKILATSIFFKKNKRKEKPRSNPDPLGGGPYFLIFFWLLLKLDADIWVNFFLIQINMRCAT